MCLFLFPYKKYINSAHGCYALTRKSYVVASALDMKQLQQFFADLYGSSNARFSETGIANRIMLAVSRASNADRKYPEEVPARPCHCVSWSFALANKVGVDVNMALALKFQEVCGYCCAKPCKCRERRSEHRAPTICNPEQLIWQPHQWQEHLVGLYGRANRRSGGNTCFRRLYDEVGELIEIAERLGGIDIQSTSPSDINRLYTGEIADVFAWLFAVADILNISLEKEVWEHFKNGCPHCLSNPCSCQSTTILKGQVINADSHHLPKATDNPETPKD